MTAFDQPFLFLRTPGGNVEDLDRMKQAGFQGVFVNIGDHEPEAWDAVVRPRAQANGMFCGPWIRTAGPGNTWAPDRLEYVCVIAEEWGSPLIVNAESEIKESGDAITGQIAEETAGLDAAVSMEAWLFNPPSVDWTPVAHLPMLLQIFPQESPASLDPAGCKQHAHDCGIRCCYFTFGSYGGMKPAQFDLTAPYSIYTADDMGQDYNAWRPTADGFQACVQTPEVNVETIGSQHGLDAMLAWMQKQPNVPQRGAGYNPNDMATWPWPDKVHRALTILVNDHDAGE